MGKYRDDHDAALLRADALERDLRETKAELAAKQRALDEVEEKLEAREHAVERYKQSAESEAADRDAAALRLDELRGKGAERKKERERKRSAKPAKIRRLGESLWPIFLRRLRSMIFGGEVLLGPDVLILLVPGCLISIYLTGIARHALGLATPSYKVVGISFAATLLMLPGLYAYSKLAFARRWAKSRPYTLVGYPDLLGCKPPSYREAGRLSISLDFVGSRPLDLLAVLEGFDEEITSRGGCRFSRSWPVSMRYSKSRSRTSNADTNWHVRRWIRRFERDVLRSLHEVSPLHRVSFGN